MRIALAQLNTTVGDIAGNEGLVLEAYRRGVETQVELVLTPELSLTGYPPRDLLLRESFIRANQAALERLAAAVGEVVLIVGFVGENPVRPGRPLTNAAALLHRGSVVAIRTKTLLPTYDVFDEDRYFDVFVEYAKGDVEDILIRITAINRGPDPARLHILPTVWFRNTWSWGRDPCS